jgi:hypothetical protein
MLTEQNHLNESRILFRSHGSCLVSGFPGNQALAGSPPWPSPLSVILLWLSPYVPDVGNVMPTSLNCNSNWPRRYPRTASLRKASGGMRATPRFHLPPIRRTLPSQPPKNPPAANAVANRDMPVIHAFVCRPSGSNTRFPLCPSTAITVRQRCRQQPAPTTPSLPGTNTPNFPKRPPSSLSTKGTPAPELAVVTSAVR